MQTCDLTPGLEIRLQLTLWFLINDQILTIILETLLLQEDRVN